MSSNVQYVTLGIERDTFGIPVACVEEILDMREVSRLPHTPASLLGLIDVRGRSIPVIDLRCRLGLPPAAATASTRILVLRLSCGTAILQIGLVADRVFEVTDLDRGEVEAVPDVGPHWRSACVAGVGRRRGGFVIILDVTKLIEAADLTFTTAAIPTDLRNSLQENLSEK
ncbi:Positive regulator of CheA protein activity (CheW) [Rhodovastum atsumiense]|uniref:Chemotaxis protein CheW n=1 Tax=Rhodovastum atsumiense TaxID=504468 RepID=A0A5M6IZQ6_9PROT|nr:chemotaxis protein CheW [Rhodovastum atsumiense]KAA5613793.1 chemotaxis protein CheW [Rhodovastum atsumiense]CAH2601890.1 Positive regulator of CheA protein activity (CheW) [Rhodovastum atsumiense]